MSCFSCGSKHVLKSSLRTETVICAPCNDHWRPISVHDSCRHAPEAAGEPHKFCCTCKRWHARCEVQPGALPRLRCMSTAPQAPKRALHCLMDDAPKTPPAGRAKRRRRARLTPPPPQRRPAAKAKAKADSRKRRLVAQYVPSPEAPRAAPEAPEAPEVELARQLVAAATVDVAQSAAAEAARAARAAQQADDAARRARPAVLLAVAPASPARTMVLPVSPRVVSSQRSKKRRLTPSGAPPPPSPSSFREMREVAVVAELGNGPLQWAKAWVAGPAQAPA